MPVLSRRPARPVPEVSRKRAGFPPLLQVPNRRHSHTLFSSPSFAQSYPFYDLISIAIYDNMIVSDINNIMIIS